MNCTDCRDQAAAHLEHLLDPEAEAALDRHLADCRECRDYLAATALLHGRLVARAAAATGVALASPVMDRIQAGRTPHRAVAPAARPARWWLGLGTLATAAAAAGAIALLVLPRESKAGAIDVMNRGILSTAQLKTVHLQGRMRTPPADNFSLILPRADFTPIELWKELDGQKRWRVEKPGRVAWMDGQSTALYRRSAHEGSRFPIAARSAFDTDWLHHVADIETTLTNGLQMAQTQGWKMELSRTTDAAGGVHQLVTIDVPSAVPEGDYVYNKFLPGAATRRCFQFNDQSGQLEALQIYLRDQGDFRLVFEATKIDYNQPFADKVFAPELPADVTWSEPAAPGTPSSAPIDPKYVTMTAEQAARTFLEACARQDWPEVQAFWPAPLNDRRKESLAGITSVIDIGQAFSSAGYPGQFVPYQITFKNGATKQHNLALKKNPRTGTWYFDGGL